MKILFLVRDKNHPAPRYRVAQYLDYLNEHGIQTDVMTAPKSIWKWWQLTRKAGNWDVVFIQKKRVTPFWLKHLRKNSRLIYDFDDAVMFNSSRHDSPDSPARMKHFINTVSNVDGVIAGNDYLQSLALPHNSRVWVIPTSIETKKYSVKEHHPNDTVTLGWIGGRKSLVFLKKLSDVLDRIHDKHKTTRLKIVCNDFFDCAGMPVMKKQWSELEEVNDILSFDIGLAPLPDDLWSRGKCATKLLQCMAAGLPAVASPVGVHNQIIKENINGFLAKTDQEWFDQISRLVESIELRRNLGLAGRATVEQGYSINANAPKLLDIIKEVLK
ncbi:MAG: glycosyltransferase family 4 protein [Candidatus Brocadiia bacterium]